VIVRIVGELENVGRERLLVLGRVAVLGSILVHNAVCIGTNILVWVESDENRRTNVCVNVVGHKTLSKASSKRGTSLPRG